ncbi:MAG: hypothetical protein HY736_27535 [Verrucomicrobia bacterium]|nr:hypothetical protein [Verrucomicrobiota bacterium]
MHETSRHRTFSSRWKTVPHFFTSVLLVSLAGICGAPLAASEPFRVCLVGADRQSVEKLNTLKGALEKTFGFACSLAPAMRSGGGRTALDPLRSAQAAVFYHGPGTLAEGDAAVLREFIGSGKGCVVIGASEEAWSALAGFSGDILGATPGDRFAHGSPMTVINLFPHPIFTGVTKFETQQAMTQYTKLASDAQMIMEGTVGDETTPLAWVRRRPSGRVCHLVPDEPGLFSDPYYQKMVGNALLWTCGRPVPGAHPFVQRTYMPDAHPGSFAITLPNGPSVCLDPVRGGINYIWDGDFVDLRPRWLTKQGAPAGIFGEVFYREKTWQPLRLGAPNREPDFHFRGYTLRDGLPEFHYLIDGRDVYETIGPGKDGAGVLRRFRVGPGAGPLWLNLEPQPGAEISLRGLERDGDRVCFPSSATGEFTIEIHRKTGGATP